MENEKNYKVVSIVGNKGGIGKSIITFQVGSILANEHNKKVLFYDGDSQRSIEGILQNQKIYYDKDKLKIPNMFYNIVEGLNSRVSLKDIENLDINQYIHKTSNENVDVLLNSDLMNRVPDKISSLEIFSKQKILKEWFSLEKNKEALKEYDYIFLDNDASLKTLTHNIMYVSDSIIVLTTLDSESIEGVKNYINELVFLNSLDDRLDLNKLKGILINRARLRTNIDKFGLSIINSEEFKNYKPYVLDNYINEYKIIGEAKLTGETFEEVEHKKAYKQLRDVVDEFHDKEVF